MGKSTSNVEAIFRDSEAAVQQRADSLESYSASALIRGALSVYGDEVRISTAFGAGGLCVLHMAQQCRPDVAVYTIDTGFLFPETHGLVERWQQEQGLNLSVLHPLQSPDEQAAEHGAALWESAPDRCCALRKVEPNQRALAGGSLWITALRRDESSSRSSTPILQEIRLVDGSSILKLCPIIGWSKARVWAYIMEQGLPYNPLHDQGYPSLGCTHCTVAVAPGDDERAGRWSGQAKQECGLHLPTPASGATDDVPED